MNFDCNFLAELPPPPPRNSLSLISTVQMLPPVPREPVFYRVPLPPSHNPNQRPASTPHQILKKKEKKKEAGAATLLLICGNYSLQHCWNVAPVRLWAVTVRDELLMIPAPFFDFQGSEKERVWSGGMWEWMPGNPLLFLCCMKKKKNVSFNWISQCFRAEIRLLLGCLQMDTWCPVIVCV